MEEEIIIHKNKRGILYLEEINYYPIKVFENNSNYIFNHLLQCSIDNLTSLKADFICLYADYCDDSYFKVELSIILETYRYDCFKLFFPYCKLAVICLENTDNIYYDLQYFDSFYCKVFKNHYSSLFFKQKESLTLYESLLKTKIKTLFLPKIINFHSQIDINDSLLTLSIRLPTTITLDTFKKHNKYDNTVIKKLYDSLYFNLYVYSIENSIDKLQKRYKLTDLENNQIKFIIDTNDFADKEQIKIVFKCNFSIINKENDLFEQPTFEVYGLSSKWNYYSINKNTQEKNNYSSNVYLNNNVILQITNEGKALIGLNKSSHLSLLELDSDEVIVIRSYESNQLIILDGFKISNNLSIVKYIINVIKCDSELKYEVYIK